MKRLLLLLLTPLALWGQSPLTAVSDTITYADGSHPSGHATITWGRSLNDANPRQVIAPGSLVITITNGVVSTSLFPNAAMLPPGTCYGIQYTWSTGGPGYTRYWYIPISAAPVTLQQIEGTIPCPTTSPVSVAPGQIVPGAAGVTQVLTSSPSGFVSWATGGGGTSPGGINGQIQYNNLGSFGGFTIGGDCLLSRPNLICTSTNGVAFSPSATTDTTNAANISSGTLPNARLSAVPNSALANSSITVNTTSPLSGGGAVVLGGSLTLSCPTCSASSTITLSGDVTGSGTSSIATTIVNVSAGAVLTYIAPTAVSAPGTPPLGSGYIYEDSTSKALALKNDAGVVTHGVQSLSATPNNFVTALSDSGVLATAQPACGNLSNASASCSTDATNASNISSGTLASARLPAINLAASGAGGVTGNLPVTNLNGGTGANGSTFWAGDGTWKPSAGGGTVTNTPGPLTAGHLMVGNGGVDSTVVASLGTSTTVYHGNVGGVGSFGSVVLTTDVSGILPFANGGLGTGTNFSNHFFFGNNTGSTAAPVATQPTFADLAAGTAGALATFPGGTLFHGGVDAQSGTTYTMVAADDDKLLTFNNASAVAVTLPQATTSGFGAGAFFILFNRGAGAVTVTPTTSTINGGASIALNQNQGAYISSDGTNYSAWVSAAPSGSGTLTSIATTSPITGGTITTSGTIACPTCATSAASLAANQLVIGSGSQGIQTLGSLGTTTTVYHGNAAGAGSFSAVSLTADISGLLPLANGGTNANLTASNGGIFYSTSSAGAILAGTATANQVLLSGSSTAPAWSTATYPGTATANQILYASATNVWGGLGSANNGTLTTSTSGVPSYTTSSAALQNFRRNVTNSAFEFVNPQRPVVADFNWSPQSPAGTLTAGISSGAVTLTPCPLGVPQPNQFVRIAGTGTPETPAVTAQSGSGSTCTITFTPANSHSAGWTIGPASSGLQEAWNYNPNLAAGPGTYAVYAPAIMPSNASLWCAERFSTVFQAQGNVGIIDATGSEDDIEHCGFTATAQQTSGYGIRFGQGAAPSTDNAFSIIRDDYFQYLYDELLGVNWAQWTASDNVFYNWSHTAITAADANNTDTNGGWTHDNVFFEQTNTSAAEACLYITSGGANTFNNNKCFGSNVGSGNGQLNYNVHQNSTVSTQLVLADNVLETVNNNNVNVTGVFNLVSINGGTIAQPSTTQSGWRGIEINGNNSSACGSSTGICQGTITGVTIQGPGSGSTSSVCVSLDGYVRGFHVSGNNCEFSQIAYNTASTVTASTIGPNNNADIYSQELFGGSTGVTWLGMNTFFSALPTAANGSNLYVRDSNSGCTAGSSSGRNCARENGAWVGY